LALITCGLTVFNFCSFANHLALQTSADKNQSGDKDAAEEKFRELKDAYDTLRDPHERAWYDTHRADLLRGAAPGSNGGAASSPIPNLDPYLGSSCFTGFGSDKESFYTVYAALFDTLARLERDADPDDSYESDDQELRATYCFFLSLFFFLIFFFFLFSL
jgi:DnaJ family protein A protein 5